MGFLLVGQADTEWVWWGYDQTHRGHQHVQASWTSDVPSTALTVVLQDGLVVFTDHLLWTGMKPKGRS